LECVYKWQLLLVVSEDIIFEYQEVLQQRGAEGVAEIVMEILIESPDVLHQHVYYNWSAIEKDPDDNKFFDIAIAANADYLVTNDTHFNAIKKQNFPSVKIISADEFLAIVSS